MKEGQVGWTIHKRRKLIWSDAGRVSRDCERPCVLGKEFRAYPKNHRKLLVANRNTTSFTLGNDHPVLNIVCVLRAGRKWQVDQLSTYCNNPGERYQDSGLEWWYQKYRKLDRFENCLWSRCSFGVGWLGMLLRISPKCLPHHSSKLNRWC